MLFSCLWFLPLHFLKYSAHYHGPQTRNNVAAATCAPPPPRSCKLQLPGLLIPWMYWIERFYRKTVLVSVSIVADKSGVRTYVLWLLVPSSLHITLPSENHSLDQYDIFHSTMYQAQPTELPKAWLTYTSIIEMISNIFCHFCDSPTPIFLGNHEAPLYFPSSLCGAPTAADPRWSSGGKRNLQLSWIMLYTIRHLGFYHENFT